MVQKRAYTFINRVPAAPKPLRKKARPEEYENYKYPLGGCCQNVKTLCNTLVVLDANIIIEIRRNIGQMNKRERALNLRQAILSSCTNSDVAVKCYYVGGETTVPRGICNCVSCYSQDNKVNIIWVCSRILGKKKF